MKHRFASRFIVFSVLLALIFSTVGTAPAKAWGPFSHTEIVRLALDLLSDSDMRDLLQDYQGSVLAGSVFPDWGMGYAFEDGIDKDKFNNLAEYAHWSEFITAYLDYVRQNYSQPYDVQESKSIAFMFGIIAHNVGDPFFHNYLLPHALLIDKETIKIIPDDNRHTVVEAGVDTFNIFREIWCLVIPRGCAYEYLSVDWYLPTDPILAAYAEISANGITSYELDDVNDLTAGWAAYKKWSGLQIAGEASVLTVAAALLPNTLLIFQDYDPGGDNDTARHVADMWARTWDILDYTGVYHVKPIASGKGDCKSWANACTLQTALGTPYGSNEVWVMGGVYKPAEAADRTATFQLRYGLDVYGGFAGTEADRLLRDPLVNLTTLSGDIDPSGENDSYHVVKGATGTTLDGFTVTKGNADGASPNDVGGGMYNVNSSPTVSNVIFSDNTASQNGGGVYNGVSIFLTVPRFRNVTFYGNEALNNGGGMYNNTSSAPTLINVTFSGNSASQNGGGIANESSAPFLMYVTIAANEAAGSGGGLYNSNSNSEIVNTILWGNLAPSGPQIEDAGTSVPYVKDSVIQGGYPGGTNIFTGDPLLGSIGNYGGWTPVIPIQEGSSAIDTGYVEKCLYFTGGLDQRGVPRPQGLACDIGAFEADITDPIVTVPSDKTVEATGPGGAVVDFIGEVSATDELSPPNPAVTCDPSSGSTFPLGVTTVTCEATDDAGNTGSNSFTITVVDTAAPTLSLPANISVPQTVSAGAVVKFTVTATDIVDPDPSVTCNPPSGSVFPVGVTTVNCSATDASGNTANGSFTATVRAGRNLLLKPDFSGAYIFPYPWNAFGVPAPFTSTLDCSLFQSAPCSVTLTSDKKNIYKDIFQVVRRSGLAGEKFSFGLSSRARYVPLTGGLYQVEVVFYNSWNKILGTSVLKLIPGTHGFQLYYRIAAAPADYTHIVFRFVFQKTFGQAWFDDAFLIKVP